MSCFVTKWRKYFFNIILKQVGLNGKTFDVQKANNSTKLYLARVLALYHFEKSAYQNGNLS